MGRACRILGFALLAGALSSLASATPARVNWSTYLRAGPGETYRAIDELRHGASVDLSACSAGWCKVSDGAAVGYVDRDSLALPATPRRAAAGPVTCFRSALPSYRGPASNLFCASATASPTPAPLRR